jgi:hypothetical protein
VPLASIAGKRAGRLIDHVIDAAGLNGLRPQDAVAASNLPGNAQRNAAAGLRPPPLPPL